MYIVHFDLIRQFKLALLSKHTNAKIRFSELKTFEYSDKFVTNNNSIV